MILEIWRKVCPVCGATYESQTHWPEHMDASPLKLQTMARYAMHLAQCKDRVRMEVDFYIRQAMEG